MFSGRANLVRTLLVVALVVAAGSTGRRSAWASDAVGRAATMLQAGKRDDGSDSKARKVIGGVARYGFTNVRVLLDEQRHAKRYSKFIRATRSAGAALRATPDSPRPLALARARLIECRAESTQALEYARVTNSLGVALSCIERRGLGQEFVGAARAQARKRAPESLDYAAYLFNASINGWLGERWGTTSTFACMDTAIRLFRAHGKDEEAYLIVLSAAASMHERMDGGDRRLAVELRKEIRDLVGRGAPGGRRWPRWSERKAAENGDVYLVPLEHRRGDTPIKGSIGWFQAATSRASQANVGFLAGARKPLFTLGGDFSPEKQLERVRIVSMGFPLPRSMTSLSTYFPGLESLAQRAEEMLERARSTKQSMEETLQKFDQLDSQFNISAHSKWADRLSRYSKARHQAELEAYADSMLAQSERGKDYLVLGTNPTASRVRFPPGFPGRAEELELYWQAVDNQRTQAVAGYLALNKADESNAPAVHALRVQLGRTNLAYWEMMLRQQRLFDAETELDKYVGRRPDSIRWAYGFVDSSRRHVVLAREHSEELSQSAYRDVTDLPWDVAGIERLNLQQTASMFGAGAVLVTFAGDGDGLAVVMMPRRGTSGAPKLIGAKLPGRYSAWRDTVRVFQALVESPTTDAFVVLKAGRRLFDSIFPTEELRAAVLDADRIVLAPGGPLADIPFALLATGEDERSYLGLMKPLSYTESFGLLRYSRRPASTGRSQSPLLAGNPVLSGVRGAFMGEVSRNRLPAAEHEVDRLVSRVGGVALKGLDVTEQRIRRALPSASMVVLATHGIELGVDFTPPLAAGVLLGTSRGCADGQSECDGAFQAWEALTALRLNAKCVVLSGCMTGRVWYGYGTVGEFVRALTYAGAHAVFACQWDEDDSAGQVLVESLHERMLEGKPKDESLRLAMSAVASVPGWKHPYFWGSMRLIGDEAPAFQATERPRTQPERRAPSKARRGTH